MTNAILINSPSYQFSITYREGKFTVCGQDWFRDEEEVFDEKKFAEDCYILIRQFIHIWATFSLIQYENYDAHSELIYNEVFVNIREKGEKGNTLSQCIDMLRQREESKNNGRK